MDKSTPTMTLNWPAFGAWIAKMQANSRPAMSDRELARRVGISATHIGEIKKGKTGTTMQKVEAIAQALGSTQKDAVVVLMPPPYPGLQEDSALIGKRLGPILARAAPDQREEILDTLEEMASRMVKISVS